MDPRSLDLEYRQALDECSGPNGSSWSEQPITTKDYPEPSIQMALWLVQACERKSRLTAFEDGPRAESQIIGGPSPACGWGVGEGSSGSSDGWSSWTVGSNSDCEDQEMADLHRPCVAPSSGDLEWPVLSLVPSPFRGAFTVVAPLKSSDVFVSPRPGILLLAQGGVPAGTEGYSWGQTRGGFLQAHMEGFGRPSQFNPTP